MILCPFFTKHFFSLYAIRNKTNKFSNTFQEAFWTKMKIAMTYSTSTKWYLYLCHYTLCKSKLLAAESHLANCLAEGGLTRREHGLTGPDTTTWPYCQVYIILLGLKGCWNYLVHIKYALADNNATCSEALNKGPVSSTEGVFFEYHVETNQFTNVYTI